MNSKHVIEVLMTSARMPNGIMTCSGTGSLLTVLLALELPPGSEVVFPVDGYAPLTMLPLMLGLKPVFADIDPKTGTLCPGSLEKALSPHTRCVIAIHMAGLPVDPKVEKALEKRKDIVLIEDFCQALGTLAAGGVTPSKRALAAFLSFSSSKLCGIGAGGAILSRDEHFINNCAEIVSNGQAGRHCFARIGLGLQLHPLLEDELAKRLTSLDSEIAAHARRSAGVAMRVSRLCTPLPAQFAPGVIPHKLICRSNYYLSEQKLLPFRHIAEVHYPHPPFQEKFYLDAVRRGVALDFKISNFPGLVEFSSKYLAFRLDSNADSAEPYEKMVESFAKGATFT